MPCNVKEYQREYQKKYRLANKDHLDAYLKNWRAKNKDRTAELCRSYYQSNKTKIREYKWKLRYGLTREDIYDLYASQDGCCAICKKELNDVFVVDHCHSNGQVRGLLCNQCNQAIGLLNEDVSAFSNAIDYIKRSQ